MPKKDDLPVVHPRAFQVRVADTEMEGFVLDLMKNHKLTYAETFMLLAVQTQRLASSCLKAERGE